MSRTPFRRLAPDAEPDVAGRKVSYVFSDSSVGRDGHVIAADAWQLDNFRANPVFLWQHQAAEPAIGRVTSIGMRAGKLVGTVEYADRDTNPFADLIYRLVKGHYLSAVSTSWIPIDFKYSADRARPPGSIDFAKVEMLECSQVTVPALPTALATARAAGIDVRPLGAWAESAIDRGDLLPKEELQMIRSAAGATRRYSSGFALPRTSAPSSAGTSPFSSFGEFLRAVMMNANAATDSRLVRAPTGAGEVDPTAGGFLVPDTFSEQLIGSLYEQAVLAPLCDRRETDAPENARLPCIDETSRAEGSRWGGVLSYWKDEGVSPTATLPKFKALQFVAKKLIALCIASEELIRDVPLLSGHLLRAFGAEAAFQLDKSILRGTGAGVPLGIVAAPGTITVAKATGQATATIVAENIAAMWSRLPAPCRRRAVWIVNEDVEQQLELIGSQGGSASTTGMYYPAGAGGNEFALVKGRPVIVAEQAPLLGTPGDIALADLSQYVIVDGGLRSAMSLDVEWLTYQGAFRFALHVDGKPAWPAPITPYNGGATRSPFVILAQR